MGLEPDGVRRLAVSGCLVDSGDWRSAGTRDDLHAGEKARVSAVTDVPHDEHRWMSN